MVHVIGFAGFIQVADEIQAATVMDSFRNQYPEDIFPYLTVEKRTLLLNRVQGKSPQCSALVPVNAVHLTDDTPLLCSLDIWSTWPKFWATFWGMVLGVVTQLSGLIIPDPHQYPVVTSVVTIVGMLNCLFSFCITVWALSRGRLWLLLKSFDAMYTMGNVLIWFSLLTYAHHVTLSNIEAQIINAIVSASCTIPLGFCFICVDAVQQHDVRKKILAATLMVLCMSVYFVGFRFVRGFFSNEAHDALDEVIEIGVLRADIGVLLGAASLNLCIFGAKHFLNLLKGDEFTILKFPWRSHILQGTDGVRALAANDANDKSLLVNF